MMMEGKAANPVIAREHSDRSNLPGRVVKVDCCDAIPSSGPRCAQNYMAYFIVYHLSFIIRYSRRGDSLNRPLMQGTKQYNTIAIGIA
jgi:hypothetical protein